MNQGNTMRNFPYDADNTYDKVIINGETHYSFHSVVRENPDTQFDVNLLKKIADLNEQSIWKIITLGHNQLIFYHNQVWEEAYPDAILPD